MPQGKGELGLLDFFVLMPDAIDIPEDWTYLRLLKADAPEADQDFYRSLREEESLSQASGREFIRVRFWQGTYEQDHPLNMHRAAVHKVMERMSWWMTASGPQDETEWQSDLHDRYTVAQLTVLERDQEDSWDSARFFEAFDILQQIVRAYRISARRLIQPISLERLFPYVPVVFRTPQAPKIDEFNLILLADNHHLQPLHQTTLLDDQALKRMGDHIRFDLMEQPFMESSELWLDARTAYAIRGDYRSAVILAHASAESRFDALLMLMLWEEGRSPKESAAIMSAGFARRIRTEYHERLGGNWSQQGKGSIAAFVTNVAAVRHRVVHGAYMPTQEEVESALESLTALDPFIRTRLAARYKSYPRTSLMTLGSQGLKLEGIFDEMAGFIIDKQIALPSDRWLSEFRAWRKRVGAERLLFAYLTSDITPRIGDTGFAWDGNEPVSSQLKLASMIQGAGGAGY